MDIQLGEAFAAAFVGAPGTEIHRFHFYAPATTVLSATSKITFSNGGRFDPLVVVIALFKADGTPVNLGSSLYPSQNRISSYVTPQSGEYYFQVVSTSGAGEYSFKTTAKFPRTTSLETTASSVEFAAVAESLLTAKVVSLRGSAAIPSFDQLVGPYGDIPLPLVKAGGSKATVPNSKLTKILLPFSGEYTLGIANAGGPGAVKVSMTIAAPRARHSWYLGPSAPPTVTLSVANGLMQEAAGVATFTAALSAAAGQPVTVNLAFSGTATLNSDYTRSGTQIVIAAGNSTGSITVTAVQDALNETSETIVVDIDTVTNATESGTQQQSAIILDDDATPMFSLWQGSGHADASSEVFNHWNAEGSVSQSCARCHSSYGFRDFIGDDGTRDNRFDHPAQADGPAALGTTVDCNACHNDAATKLDAVVFPSDRLAVAANPLAVPPVAAKPARPAVAMDLGPEARCMQCHQGRESTNSMDEYIASKNPLSDDNVTAGMSFRNVHYFAAAATLYGGGARGAYQYRDGQSDAHLYDGLNPHVPEANTCVECHNPHSLEVEVAELCSKCHVTSTKGAVATTEDLKDIRMPGSTADYDGDGDSTEGIYYELSTMAATLYTAIQAYATNIAGTPIAYDPGVYPYFAKATGGSYTSWTPRLLRAAYNYHYYVKDPGTFAHNPKYMIEILYDSIADLAAAGVDVPQLANMHRSDSGHFDGQSEVFRHWDVDGATNDMDRGDVDTSCAPCHSNGGFNFRATYGIDTPVPMPAADGMECGTCHVGDDFDQPVPSTKYIAKVEFPGSPTATVINNSSSNPDTSFICMSCHRGRESMSTLDADIAAQAAANKRPRFRNVHYLPAGAILYGSQAKVAYMFRDASTYSTKWNHYGGTGAQCKYCHLPSHTFEVQLKWNCVACHTEAGDDVEAIRMNRTNDYNGVNGNADTLKEEVQSFADALIVAMNTYAAANGLDAIVYSPDAYPYFFKASGASYTTWDATLVKAAFNYQLYNKEPGAWAHNTKFIMQVLYDSIDICDDGQLNNSPPLLSRPVAAK